MDPRRSPAAVRIWLRLAYALGRGLAAAGVPPGMVTGTGVVVSVLVPVAAVLGDGWLVVAAGLVLVAAVADSADGAVAVVSARTSRLGAFDDSMADRLSEAAWLLGLWLAGVPGVLVTICGALAWLHEYARARATASGMSGIGAITVAERPTRVLATSAAFALGGAAAALVSPGLARGVMSVVVSFWALLGLLGAARLLGAIRAHLS